MMMTPVRARRELRSPSSICLAAAAVAAWTSAAVAQAPAKDKKPQGLAILNVKVWDGRPAPVGPQDRPAPTAIYIVGDRIVALGSNDEILARGGPAAKTIFANNSRVIPGLTDSHTHLISGGFQLRRLNLRDVADREQFIKQITDAAKEVQKGQWVLGGRWSVESWEKPESPRASWIDEHTGETPVFLSRMDGHQALVNSAALKLAGIDRSGPADPPGGEIERDPKTKEPTGILKESAMGLVRKHIPDPTAEDKMAALERAMKHANQFGVTAVQDMSDWDDLPVFAQAAKEGKLTLRITSYVTSDQWSSEADKVLAAAKEHNSDKFTIAGFKGYMDGSMGSRTAYMREPFADVTSETLYPRGQLTAFASSASFLDEVAAADAKGLQLAVHAIGDEGNHLVLNAYEEAAKRNGPRERLHRIEHAQHLIPADIPRFAKLGVVASMQPLHKADDGRYAEKAIGKERLAGSYAFRQLVESGALLTFGSDWPVVSMNPFLGIDAAVNARTLAGDIWLADHSLTVEQALHAYTTAPARAIHREKDLGTIEPGKLADLVILQSDPLEVPKSDLATIKVLFTIVGGEVV